MVLRTLAWLCVPLAGLVELGGHFYFSTRAPKVDDWVRSKPTVASLRKDGDLIVVAPDWAEPNARLAFGDAWFPLADVARPDESAYSRALEIGIVGASAPELRGWKLVEQRRHGKFTYRVLENPRPAKVSFDFVNHVSEATVADMDPAGVTTPCRWNPAAVRSAGGLHGDPAFPSQRHECSGGANRFVGVTVIEDEQWRGRRCMWAMPPNRGSLSIRYSAVTLGPTVRGYAALPQWIEREKRGAPVEMEVFANGQPIGKYVHRDGDGWKAFSFSTGALAGSPADVEFKVATSRPRDRQFCFQADTR
jgi:hypothetical protein